MFIPMLFYRDDCALDEESDDQQSTRQAAPPGPVSVVATTTGEAVAAATTTPTTVATVAATAMGSASGVPTLASLAREASPPGATCQLGCGAAACGAAATGVASAAAECADEDEDPAAKVKGRHVWLVPHILFWSDLCFAIGSGSKSGA